MSPQPKRPALAIVAAEPARSLPDGAFLRFIRNHCDALRRQCRLSATDGTRTAILATGFFHKTDIERLPPGGQGGLLEVAYRITTGECDAVLFLYDPSDIRSESPESRALLRVCIEKRVPFLSTPAAAKHWLALASPAPRAPFDPRDKTVALIAHDAKKEEFQRLLSSPGRRSFLAQFSRILATGTTGTLLRGWYPDLAQRIQPCLSGPRGGDVQIAHEISCHRCHAVIFLQDPLTPHPHEPDIALLRRTCQLSMHDVILLSDVRTAADWLDKQGESVLSSAELAESAGTLRRALVIPERDIARPLAALERLRGEHGGSEWRFPDDVWSGHERHWSEIHTRLARVSAHYVDGLLREYHLKGEAPVLAVGWGRAIYLFASELERLRRTTPRWEPIPDVTVWPLLGNCGVLHDELFANNIAKRVAAVYDGDVEQISLGLSRWGDRGLSSSQLKRITSAQITVTSIGAVPLRKRRSGRTVTLNHEFTNAVFDPVVGKAIGDLVGLCFNSEGADVPSHYYPGVLRLDSFREMARSAHVVAIAGGDTRKNPAIRAAVKGGLISALATDEPTARVVTS